MIKFIYIEYTYIDYGYIEYIHIGYIYIEVADEKYNQTEREVADKVDQNIFTESISKNMYLHRGLDFNDGM